MSCVRQRFLNVQSRSTTSNKSITPDIYHVLYLDRRPRVDEYDERFYNNSSSIPSEADYAFKY